MPVQHDPETTVGQHEGRVPGQLVERSRDARLQDDETPGRADGQRQLHRAAHRSAVLVVTVDGKPDGGIHPRSGDSQQYAAQRRHDAGDAVCQQAQLGQSVVGEFAVVTATGQ